MNNFLFGNSSFGYYETICGGVGAEKGFNGADAIHQHQTGAENGDRDDLTGAAISRCGHHQQHQTDHG